MSFDILLPNMSGNPATATSELQTYLFQMVSQLNWALNTIEKGSSSGGENIVIKKSATPDNKPINPEATFNAIKSLIIKSADIVEAYQESLSEYFNGKYVAVSNFGDYFGAYIEDTSALIEKNSKNITQTYTQVSSIQKGIADINTNVNGLSDDVSGLNTRIGGINENITEIQGNVSSLANNISGVEGDIESVRSNIAEVENDVGNVKTNVDGINKNVEGLGEEVTTLGNNVVNLGATIGDIDKSVSDVESDVSGIKGNINTIETMVRNVTAYIKTGELYTDSRGFAVYGVEIGQKNIDEFGKESFNSFARFTASKLSFFDQNGIEVAYISNQKLYITQAHILGEIQLGGYICDLTDGIAFKWVGR